MPDESGLAAFAKDLGAQEFWMRRLVAVILDGLIVAVATWAIALGPFPRGPLEYSLVAGLLFYFYSVVFTWFTGTTPGKKILGLRVVGIRTKVDGARLLVREASKLHVVALALDVLAGFLVEKNGRLRYLEVLSDTTEVLDRA